MYYYSIVIHSNRLLKGLLKNVCQEAVQADDAERGGVRHGVHGGAARGRGDVPGLRGAQARGPLQPGLRRAQAVGGHRGPRHHGGKGPYVSIYADLLF